MREGLLRRCQASFLEVWIQYLMPGVAIHRDTEQRKRQGWFYGWGGVL